MPKERHGGMARAAGGGSVQNRESAAGGGVWLFWTAGFRSMMSARRVDVTGAFCHAPNHAGMAVLARKGRSPGPNKKRAPAARGKRGHSCFFVISLGSTFLASKGGVAALSTSRAGARHSAPVAETARCRHPNRSPAVVEHPLRVSPLGAWKFVGRAGKACCAAQSIRRSHAGSSLFADDFDSPVQLCTPS